MTRSIPPTSNSITRIDISPSIPAVQSHGAPPDPGQGPLVALLERLVALQEEQLQLARKSAKQAEEARRRRRAEARQWHERHPELAAKARRALEVLDVMQRSLLDQMAEHVAEHEETLVDGEFMFNEFVDRFGPRMAHLAGMLALLGQLAAGAPAELEEE